MKDLTLTLLLMFAFILSGFSLSYAQQTDPKSIKAQKAERERLRYIDQERYMHDRDLDVSEMQREIREEQEKIKRDKRNHERDTDHQGTPPSLK